MTLWTVQVSWTVDSNGNKLNSQLRKFYSHHGGEDRHEIGFFLTSYGHLILGSSILCHRTMNTCQNCLWPTTSNCPIYKRKELIFLYLKVTKTSRWLMYLVVSYTRHDYALSLTWRRGRQNMDATFSLVYFHRCKRSSSRVLKLWEPRRQKSTFQYSSIEKSGWT